MVYCLPYDAVAQSINTMLSDLVLENETMIIIKTSPVTASVIARIIDNEKCKSSNEASKCANPKKI